METEQVCPELLQGEPGAEGALEARMDLHLWGSDGALLEEWLDVTLTHPYRKSARKGAAEHDGAAAEAAEERKRRRYGVGAGGISCGPFGLELWGRGGVSALAVLDRLSSQCCQRSGRPRHLVQARWRAELGVALNRALAATVEGSTRPQPHTAGADSNHLAEGAERQDSDGAGDCTGP